MTPPLVLVTGGAGFIGSNVVAELAGAGGFDIAVCDRLRTAAGGKWRNLARHGPIDLVAPEDLAEWLAGRGRDTRIVIHMGAISSTAEPDADKILRVNFGLSRDLFEWCAEHGRRFIYASSAAVYGDGALGFDDDPRLEAVARLRPLNAYGWSKQLFDAHVLRQAGRGRAPPQWAGLRFFNVYGPNEGHKGDMRSVAARIWPSVAAGKAVQLFRSYRAPWPDGGQERDFVHVRDAARVAAWLVGRPDVSGVFNVGSGVARTFADLAGAVFAAAGRPVRIDYVDMPEALRDAYQYSTLADVGRLRAAGYDAPFAALELGIADYVLNFLARNDARR